LIRHAIDPFLAIPQITKSQGDFALLGPRTFQEATIEVSAPDVLPRRFRLADFRDSNMYRIEKTAA
jgi:hypothetical protein